MRKNYSRFLLGIFCLLSSIFVSAQVSVTATAGTAGPTPYTNLSSAFAAINAGTHQGAITIDINASFTDVASAVLNSNAAAPAAYTSVVIRPVVDGVTMSFPTVTGRGVIELNGADNVTIDGDNPNTGGTNRNLTITNTAANTVGFTSCIRIALVATTVTSADNNAFRNLNLIGSSTGRNISTITSEGAGCFGVVVSAGASGATTAPAALASMTTTVAGALTAANLQISNNNIQTVSRGIAINGAATTVAPGLVVSNNLIGNSTAAAVDQVWSIGITVQGSTNAIISGNTVYVEGFVQASASNKGIDFGVVSATGSGATIENNIIGRAVNNDQTGWTACGINIAGGTNHIVRNNFVMNVMNNQVAGTGSFGSTFGAYGIRIGGGTGHLILHNSVNMSGAVPGVVSTDLTAAFIMSSTAQTGVSVRNNIFSNTVTGGNPAGTRNVAIALPSAGTSAMSLTLNNNAYFGNADALNRLAQVGTTFGTGEFTYANFNAGATSPATNLRSYTSTLSAAGTNDNSSIALTSAAPFTSATNLHIPNGTATPLESGGASAGVLLDIDGQPRSVTTPDIGADEFVGTFVDIIPPSITYTALSSTCSAGNIALNGVIISDASGVPTAGTLVPRVYYRKNAGAYFSQPGTLGSGTGTNGTWNFTIVAADMGGVAIGDVVSYYVIAQDIIAPTNISSSPSGVVATDVNTVITHPASPNTYGVGGVLNGTYTVGVGGNFPTLTSAAAVYNAGCGLGGAVTFNLIDAAYPSETYPITFNQNPAASATNTLTIKPAATATLSGNVNNGAILRILGNWITINGSSTLGTSRDLTITNTSTTGPSVVLFGSVGTTPITNSGLRNSIVINGANTASAVVTSDATTLGNAGFFNNITIQNNSIQRAFIGSFNIAVVAPGNGSGLLLTGNDLSTSGANSIRLACLYVQGVDGATVSNNTLGNISNTLDASNFTGIWFATSTINSSITGNTITNLNGTSTAPRGIAISSGNTGANINVANNTISGLTSSSTATTTGIFVFSTTTGVTVQKNTISNIKNTSTSGFGSNGIQLASTNTAADVNVTNNMISDVAAFGFNGTGVADNGYGIIVVSGGGYNIYYNTVNMNTNQSAAGGLPAAMNIISGVPTTGTINIRNNIFANTQTTGTQRYAIISTAPNTAFGTINNNDYYSTGPNLGIIGAVNRADITAIQAGFGGNANSISVLPVFVSGTDMHLSVAAGANWCLNGTASPIGTVTDDIDNNLRGAAPDGPDMGADEINPTGLVITNPAAACVPNTVDLTAPAVTAGSVGGLTFTYWTDALATNPLANPNAVSVAGTYYIKATSGTCFLIRPVTVSFNAQPTVNGVLVQPTTCVAANGSITLTISGTPGPYTFAWVGTGVNPTAQNQVNLTVGTYNVTVTDQTTGCSRFVSFPLPGPGGCSICPTIPTLTTNPTPAACLNSNVTLTASGLTDMGVTYGITFKYSTVALADPYVGGTVITTVPNGSLTSVGTIATANTSFGTAGNYIVYAIVSPTPLDPSCRPFNQRNLVVNPIPNADPVTNQTVCAGTPTTAINFTGAVPGTVYNWTNNTPSIGLAAAGSGNIASFNAVNAGVTAVTATITVTPSYTNGGGTCTGTPITFTITVNPTNTITTQPVNRTICQNGNTTFTVATTGTPVTYQWQINQGAGFINLTNVAPFSNVTTATLTVTGAGTVYNGNTFRVLVGPCGSAISSVVTLTVNPLPTVNAGPSGFCAPVTITANGTANTYAWTPAAGLNTTTGPTVIATPTSTTIYTVTGTITATGCQNSASVTVLGTPATPVITPAAPVICAGTIQPLTVTNPPVTQIFNGGAVLIPAGQPGTTIGNGSPYPSTTAVSGLPTSGVRVKQVIINGITHTFPEDIDIVLQSPTGQNVIVMSDIGGGTDLTGQTYTLDDQAPGLLTTGLNATGTYRPTNLVGAIGVEPDNWPAPGPGSLTQPNPTLATFTGNMNGTWNLYIVDDGGGDFGTITSWSIVFEISTSIWTPITGLFFDANAQNPYVAGTPATTVYFQQSPTVQTQYTYTVIGTLGTCSSAPATVTVTVNPKPTLVVAPINGCGPQTLTATGNFNTVTWAPITGLFTDPARTAGFAYTGTNASTVYSVNPLLDVTYTATATITGTGCVATATSTTNAIPAAPVITPSTVQVCVGTGTRLAITPAAITTPIAGPISIPAGAPTTTVGNASPYPSTISINGLATGGVRVKSVNINGISHTFPGDIDMVLIAPNGQNVIIMSDAGGGNDLVNFNLVFDDAAANYLPAVITSGTWKPTNSTGNDNFPAPGPGILNGTNQLLSSFTGNMNGDWKLFIVDQVTGDAGSITSWSITFEEAGGIWTPVTGLFTDPLFSNAYVAGTYANAVYARPATTTTYSVTRATATCTSPAGTATVNVIQPVTITTQPASQTVCQGANVTFSVVTGGNFQSYQWQVSTGGGPFTNIAGANNSSLVLTNVQPALNGNQYRVVVVNTCSTITSAAATLTVNPLPIVTVGALPAKICISDPAISLLPLGNPVGGVWTGIGVSGFNFIPSSTAVGTYTLTYTYTTALGCTANATVVAKVEDCQERVRLLRDDAVILYPNPNNGRFNIKINSTLYNYLNMKVFSSSGRLVADRNFNGLIYGRVINIDITNLPADIYMVKFYYRDGVRTSEKTFKVIVGGHE